VVTGTGDAVKRKSRGTAPDWRDAPIDAKVKPLVDALNATGVVETYASCQGHARRGSDPYVAFRCGVDVAARLDKTLHGLRLGGRLRHWWDISGFFHPEGWELRFYLRAPALTEARDDPARAFWFYILRRKAIDHDLDLLSRELCGDLDEIHATEVVCSLQLRRVACLKGERMGPRRERLPNRRAQATETVTWRGQEWLMSVGFDPQGLARETFVKGLKTGGDMAAIMDDACVLLSLLLQAGYRAGDIDGRLGREGIASPAPAASPLGLAARTAATMEREMGDGIRVFHENRAALSGATVEIPPGDRSDVVSEMAAALKTCLGYLDKQSRKIKAAERSARYEAARLGHGREAERIDAILKPVRAAYGREMAVADFEKAEGLRVAGALNLSNTTVEKLPDDLSVGGDLNLSHTVVRDLPGRLSVGGTLYLRGASIVALPDDLSVGWSLWLDGSAIRTLPGNLSLGGDLSLNGSDIETLPGGLSLGGDLDLRDTAVETLPGDLSVGGSLWLGGSTIETLPEGLSVGGDMDLRHTAIATLPESLSVGGDLYLRDTAVAALPESLSVGGNVFLNDTTVAALSEGASADARLAAAAPEMAEELKSCLAYFEGYAGPLAEAFREDIRAALKKAGAWPERETGLAAAKKKARGRSMDGGMGR